MAERLELVFGDTRVGVDPVTILNIIEDNISILSPDPGIWKMHRAAALKLISEGIIIGINYERKRNTDLIQKLTLITSDPSGQA